MSREAILTEMNLSGVTTTGIEHYQHTEKVCKKELFVVVQQQTRCNDYGGNAKNDYSSSQ